MSTFTPPYAPSYGSGDDTEIKMLSNDFGDGYKQDTPDGLNNQVETWNLAWNDISDANAASIMSQLKGFNGGPFEWTTPTGETKTFTCVNPKRVFTKYQTCNVTATFIQNFNS